MKFIKKNKYTLIVIVIFILFVFLGAKALEVFFPNEGKAIYGDRLTGIEKVRIKDSQMEQALQQLKDEAVVTEATQVTRGKLVTFMVSVVDDVAVDVAKGLANLSLSSFEENQKSYYDFQIMIEKKNEALNDFPIIGYKHHNKQDFIWTKDRVVSAE